MYIVTHRSLKMIELKQTLIEGKLERVGGRGDILILVLF